jgi:hypothetical protein
MHDIKQTQRVYVLQTACRNNTAEKIATTKEKHQNPIEEH